MSGLEFKAQTSQLVSCSWDRSIIVWNLYGLDKISRVVHDAHAHYISCIKLTSCGRLLSGSWDCTIKLWDLDRGECMQTITSKEPIYSLETVV